MSFGKGTLTFGFLTALMPSVLLPTSLIHAQERPLAVMELFTSQGCSSCPPADALLNDLSENPDFLTLSYHVDYWDYLGWKDALASPENSRRQREYSAGSDGTVYTPQLILNGKTALVGSDSAAIARALHEESRTPLPVEVDLAVHDNVLQLHIGASGAVPAGRTEILLLSVEPQREVSIEAGENSGATILYRNIVRDHRIIGMWKGAEMRLELPLDEVGNSVAQECVVLVQQVDGDGHPGPILGAARTRL
ncbi:DUF1223 domain-containing protein [Nitratireductor basaltis]|uniref:Putative secreted protein n=1 Tax=Nitratireductor basaltis TaxID=472175 RepID=A0A084U6M4_9HYPH|nr:DUF1223 domain-containing protein [Nitratireductor basaltis]KFB08610.1 putative secreted protein precursor [Nitratireductor basaltis]